MLLFCTHLLPPVSRGQDAVQPNRIQYHQRNWREYATGADFTLFYPEGYRQPAAALHTYLVAAKKDFQDSFYVPFPGEVHLFLYPSLRESDESNIGIGTGERRTDFSIISSNNNRIVLPYDGNTAEMISRLKRSLVLLSINNLTGRNNLKSKFIEDRDDWFWRGSTALIVDGWTAGDESRLAQMFAADSPHWEQLLASDSTLTGQSFAYFLKQRYRYDVIRQLYYFMLRRKSLEKAVRQVLRKDLRDLKAEYILFYSSRFARPELQAEEGIRDHPPGDHRCRVLVRGSAQVVKEWNRSGTAIDVYLETTSLSGPLKRKKLLRIPGIYNEEEKSCPDQPLVKVAGQTGSIFIISPRKGTFILEKYNNTGTRVYRNSLKDMDGIAGFEIITEDELWLSAHKDGISDVVSFRLLSAKVHPVTDDPYDQGAFGVVRDSLLVFRSGYPLTISGRDTFERPYGLYALPVLQERNGYRAGGDPVLLVADSMWLKADVAGISPEGAQVIAHTGSGSLQKDTFRLEELAGSLSLKEGTSVRKTEFLRERRYRDSLEQAIREADKDYKNEFGSIFGTNRGQQDSAREVFLPAKEENYRLRLYKAYFNAGINNAYFINKYQPYKAYGGTYKVPELGAMFTGGVADIFEDHHLNFGFRLPVGNNGSDFYTLYRNLTRRTDWELMYFRKVEQTSLDRDAYWTDERGLPYPTSVRIRTDYLGLGFHYPLNLHWRLSANLAIRKDKLIFLSTDRYSLPFAPVHELWNINSLKLKGAKIRYSAPLTRTGWSLEARADGMVSGMRKESSIVYALQLDAQHYLKLPADILVETAFRAGFSRGRNGMVLYNFGGVSGNLAPLRDEDKIFPQDAPYIMQTLVTPFRGYPQNSMYGSAYALLNLDVYVPLFRTLIPVHTGFSFIRNFQLGIWSDAAHTWRQEQVLAPAPDFLYSYGLSARTILAGYPIRVDMALGQGQPVWYLSLDIPAQ